MAAKLDLLLDWANGQGISGGLSKYVNYPVDHDSNYGSIQTTVNQMIDEINAARLADSQIPADLLLRRDAATAGRFNQDTAKVTRSGQVVTISNGLIFVAGRRIVVAGASFDYTGLSNDTYYIAVDRSGLLYNTGTISNQEFDIVTVVWTSPTLTDANVTDNLYNGSNTFTGSDVGFIQQVHIPPKETPNNAVTDVLYPGRVRPFLRYLSNTGTIGDAGFMAGDVNDFFWLGRRSTGPGSGDTVLAGGLMDLGQLQLYEQSRITAIAVTGDNSIATATLSDVTFDAPVANAQDQRTWRREPDTYFAGTPWIASQGVSLTVPGNTSCRGTYMFTASIEFTTSAAGNYRFARLYAQDSPATTIAETRVSPAGSGTTWVSLAGMIDLGPSDIVRLEIEHDAGSNITISARVSGFLLGGPVDVSV